MESIIDIGIKILAALFVVAATWAVNKAKTYFVTQAKTAGNDDIARMIEQFCEAAEQQLKQEDPTGAQRKQYVCELLAQAGVDVSEAIDAAIEAAVYRINKGE